VIRRFACLALFLLAAGSAATAGCGASPRSDEVLVVLEWEGADAPDGFVAVVTPPGGATVVLGCGSVAGAEGTGDSPLVRCVGDGVEMSRDLGTVHLLVKGRGFRTQELDVESGADASQADLVMESLPAPVVNDDYATALVGEAGEQVFQSHGVEAQTELGRAYALKFFIDDVKGSPTVYFQNSHKYDLHYTFAFEVLGKNIPRSQFDDETYEGENRKNMAGTVVWYPQVECDSGAFGGTLTAPFTLNFFPSDDLTPAMVIVAHRLLEDVSQVASIAGGNRRFIYLPPGSIHEEQLSTAVESFARRNALWISRMELYKGISFQALNPGIAYGTLRLMTPEELAATPVSFKDILVLTRLPNDLPVVGGTITEEFQTPLAHVNLAARTRGTPNMALLEASQDPRIEPFLDTLVRFEVQAGSFTLEAATVAEAEAWWEDQKKEPLVPTGDVERADLPGLAEIGFADASAFGVKCANLAELSHLLPNHTPIGFGVPFRYYDQFMGTARLTPDLCADARVDCLQEKHPAAVCSAALALCQPPTSDGQPFEEAVQRFLDDESFRNDTALREAVLDSLRWAIRHSEVDPTLSAELDQRAAEVFGEARLRLRSSTNCEDLPNFSGAGLYTSTGADASGPEAASLEIRKVWASVWNWKAFEERSFWNIDHQAVLMGVLASLAYDNEEANGVLITRNISDPTGYGMYVNVQVGEEAVTNPEGGTIPEIFTIVPAPAWDGVQVNRQCFSSLSPGVPILTLGEAADLYSFSNKGAKHFAKLYGIPNSKQPYDIEFKFVGPERHLVLKQIRPYSVSAE